MGVDYSAMLMYGVELESFEDAVAELQCNEVITEEQAEKLLKVGEIYDVEAAKDFYYQQYSYYCGYEGVLGVTLSLSDINTPALEEIKKSINGLLPNSKCELHHFVQVH